MARNTGSSRSSSSPPAGGNAQLIVGILIGMVLGLAVAGGVAWQIMKSPSPFTGKDQHVTNEKQEPQPVVETPKVEAPKTVVSAAQPQSATGTDASKQRFEFYHMLTDKESTAAPTKPAATQVKPQVAAPGETYFLQAASFTNAEEADRLKAKLAMSGLEATIQAANVPDKGVRYRVRLGPYRNAEEMRKANELLKQNGIADAAQVH